MYEILRSLPKNAHVLDLGSRDGSFGLDSCPGAVVVRLDTELPKTPGSGSFVQADAAYLPFRDGCFDTVIANHVLEHVDKLAQVLEEIGRVVRSRGSLYVAVPDASTLTDHLYRWIYHGGGHINAFRSADELTSRIARITTLPPVATRILSSSFGFLEKSHFHPRPPRRLWLLGNGNRKFLAGLSYVLRRLDSLLRTRTSMYGWAFYFGEIREEIEIAEWTNVCWSCGAGHSESSLAVNKKVRRRMLLPPYYECPNCGQRNLFTADRS